MRTAVVGVLAGALAGALAITLFTAAGMRLVIRLRPEPLTWEAID